MQEISKKPQVSIIIPTYNESKNIIQILKSVQKHIPLDIRAQTIVVDDNSPDGTGTIVDEYVNSIKKIANQTFDVIHRTTKNGLSSAILNGVRQAQGDLILVMDSDFSHPPQVIPKMIEALKKYQCDIVVASRYISGGEIKNWSIKRKIISKIATNIAKSRPEHAGAVRRSRRRTGRWTRSARCSSAASSSCRSRRRGSRGSAGALLRCSVRGLGSAKLANFANFLQNFANFWRARSRLYQNEILQENMRLTAFFKLYKMCILLHRCNLKIFAKNRFEKSAIFMKIQKKICKCRKICKFLPKF